MRHAIVVSLALALAACGSEPEVERSDEELGDAAGEVLGGEISDAMLPLENLQSSAPSAPRVLRAGDEGDAEELAADAQTPAAIQLSAPLPPVVQDAPPPQPASLPVAPPAPQTAPPIED